jgi:hypothetical protein
VGVVLGMGRGVATTVSRVVFVGGLCHGSEGESAHARARERERERESVDDARAPCRGCECLMHSQPVTGL